MSNFELRFALQQSRFNLIQRAADFDNEDNATQVTRQLVQTRLEVLDKNWTKFQEDHESLCFSGGDAFSEHQYFTNRVFERCQAFYVFSRAKLLTQRDDFDSVDRNTRSVSCDEGIHPSFMPRSALPRISLPNFNGEYNSWRSFHDLFASIIRNNADLSNVEKMHYLKTCLSGEASRLVSNLPVSGDNFAIAWEILVARYENKRVLINAQLDKLASIKPLKLKSAQGLRSFLTTISETIGALRALGCSVDSWDPILLHQLGRLLDQDTREAWEVHLGSSTVYPTFKQFEEFLIGRTRAIESLSLLPSTSSTHKERNATQTLNRPIPKAAIYTATSSSSTDLPKCPLCGDLHYLRSCTRFQAKSIQQRRELIIKHRRCFNCLGTHGVKKCISTKRCLKCGGKHHTMIHEATSRHASSNFRSPQTKPGHVHSVERPGTNSSSG